MAPRVKAAKTAPIKLSSRLGAAPAGPPRALGVYDAAQTSDRNENLWALVSGRSADREASPAVRQTLRNRARYEARNNSYCRGMIDTKANDIVGRGPRLQMLTADADYNAGMEELFDEWAQEVKLGPKLRLAVAQVMEAGEVLLVFVDNPKLRHPVKRDVRVVECDRLTGTMDKSPAATYEDGISYDELGNPVSYDIRREHPGALTGSLEYDRVPASEVIHLYRPTRPGQKRGVPEIAPALPLFAELRRYTLAVLSAAEAAADVAWALVSSSDQLEPVDIDPMDEIDIERGRGLTMPAGWKLEQMKAEQPSTRYAEFKREILNEIARCLCMPLNIALANSSGYNYSSGRLDHQTYFKDIRTRQHDLGADAVTPIFMRFCQTYRIPPGAIVPADDDGGGWVSKLLRRAWSLVGLTLGRRPSGEPHQWHWDGTEHVDPVKEASAQETRLRNLTTSLAREYASLGLDWEDELRQIARERELLSGLGLKMPESGSGNAPAPDEGDDETGGKPAGEDEEE